MDIWNEPAIWGVASVILFVVGVLILVLAGARKGHEPDDGTEYDFDDDYEIIDLGLLSRMKEAMAMAAELVAAAEQLFATHQLVADEDDDPDVEIRFTYVFDRLKQLFPDIDEDLLEAAIESSVYWLKRGAQRLTVADDSG